MPLTEEDKQRILEEEKYRAEVRGELSKNYKKSHKSFLPKSFLGWIFVLICAVPFFSGITRQIFYSPTSTSITPITNSNSSTTSTEDTLKGDVTYYNSYIEITNTDATDWGDCMFHLGAYDYANNKGLLIGKGQKVQLNYSNFTLKNGTRLNFATTKPSSFSVTCDVGYNTWELN